MRRLAIYIFTLLATPCLAQTQGRVECAGRPLSGVVVSDGFNTTLTDKRGKYHLPHDPRSRFVFVSTPSGFDTKSGAPLSYYNLEKVPRKVPKQKYDFEFKRSEDQQTHHQFIVIADPQVIDSTDLHYVANAARDIKDFAQSSDIPIHGFVCGDMVSDIRRVPLDAVADSLAISDVAMHYVVGNHDLDFETRSSDLSTHVFEQTFGPDYYSFNRGEVHYVVLNNCHSTGRGWHYIGYIEEEQLDWLEQDLKHVKAGSRVVVVMHIPSWSTHARRGEIAQEQVNKITCNRDALYAILEPFNAHICSAHEHYGESYQITPRLTETTHLPLSGLFWLTLRSMDGVPWGYTIYDVNGSDISWHYKGVGLDTQTQFEVYGLGENPQKPDHITVNLWCYEPNWRIEWWEDGEAKGPMQQFQGHDPGIVKLIEENSKRWKTSYYAIHNTEHLFLAKPSSADSKVEIRVTDSAGNQYEWSNR